MTLEDKIEILREKGYPVDDFTIAEINRHYERVIGMNIDTIKGFGDHPHQDEFEEGESATDS